MYSIFQGRIFTNGFHRANVIVILSNYMPIVLTPMLSVECGKFKEDVTYTYP